jgi:predicted nucleotidyltransferase
MDRERLFQILREYREGLEAIFGDQLERVILYGSQARGDAREDSDIDILCVMCEPFSRVEMIARTSELTAKLSLEYDVALSRKFAMKTDYEACARPFLKRVREDEVLV